MKAGKHSAPGGGCLMLSLRLLAAVALPAHFALYVARKHGK